MAGHHELQGKLRRLPAPASVVESEGDDPRRARRNSQADNARVIAEQAARVANFEILARRADLHIRSHPQHVRCWRWGSGIDAEVKLAPRASAGVRSAMSASRGRRVCPLPTRSMNRPPPVS